MLNVTVAFGFSLVTEVGEIEIFLDGCAAYNFWYVMKGNIRTMLQIRAKVLVE